MIEPVRQVEIVEVIKVVALAGNGTKADPYRNSTQYWSLDGKFLVEEKFEGEEIINNF